MRILDYRSCGWEIDVTVPEEHAPALLKLWKEARAENVKKLGGRAVTWFHKRSIEDRFWSKVDRSGGPDACWPWTAGRRSGYGSFMVSRRPFIRTTAHRVAVLLTNGPVDKDLLVCHRCDNPPCCNPAHLFVGTHTDNMRDAAQKDRLPSGSSHTFSRLTEEEVREMKRFRADGHRLRILSARYGVTESAVSRICNGINRAQKARVAKDKDEAPGLFSAK